MFMVYILLMLPIFHDVPFYLKQLALRKTHTFTHYVAIHSFYLL